MGSSLRWAYASGRQGQRSGWELPGVEPSDFTGTLNVPATTGVQTFVLLAFPPAQTLATQYGAPDAYGDGTAKLAASDATRAQGVFPGQPLGIIGNFELFSATVATGAVVAYASTFTLQLILISASDSATPGVVNNLMAALALNGLVNPWTLLALGTVPTARQVVRPDTGGIISNAMALFAGDIIVAKFANTGAGAVTVAGGNALAIGFEIF